MIMEETDHNPVGEEEREMEEGMATVTAPAPIREHFGGYIFIVDDHHFSMQSCPKRWMFGMTHHYKDPILQITPGTPLFVFDCKTGHAHGIYEAVSHGGMNLDKSAWPDLIFTGESLYPAQVRVRWARLYPPLPGRMFWPAVGYHAPDAHFIGLTVPQVHNIWEVFEVNMRICDTISRRGAG